MSEPANDNLERVYTLDEAIQLAPSFGINAKSVLDYELRSITLERSRSGVYVNECGEIVNIGVATDPVKRLDGMRLHNPYEMRLRHYEHVGERGFALLAERTAQTALDGYSVGREWFRCDSTTAKEVVGVSAALAREACVRRDYDSWRAAA